MYKKDFPIFKNNKELVYLDSAATSQKPQVVIDAITDFYSNYNANIHRGIYKIAEITSAKVDEVRKKTARFINAKYPEEIIFTKSTTEAINLVMYSWGKEFIKKGDTIVVMIMDHHSNFVPWQCLAKEKGAKLEVVDITEDGQLNIDDLYQKIKKAKLVCLPYISNMLGTINPVKDIILRARNNNYPLFLVDAAQATPHMKVDVQELDCDFLVFSGHKMLAGTGVGVLYGKKEILEKMPPFLFGGDMIKEVSLDTTTFADLPNKFEGGTLNIEGIISLGAAIDYLERIGMDKIRKHEKSLVNLCIDELSKINWINIYGPKDRAGLVSFTINNIHAHDIAQVLSDENICVRSGHHCTMPLHKRLGISASTRASFYIYNNEEDIDKLIKGIKKTIKLFK